MADASTPEICDITTESSNNVEDSGTSSSTVTDFKDDVVDDTAEHIPEDVEDPTVNSINEITSVSVEPVESNIEKSHNSNDSQSIENGPLDIKNKEEDKTHTEELHSTKEEQEKNPNLTSHEDSSDEGSEYKDAVNPASVNDQGSDCDSEELSEGSTDSTRARKRNRRLSNELKVRDSDDESLNKEDYCNEDDDEPQGTRESGDGEEKSKEKVLDRDEDKKDPQYIPKKGMFYEHDDRTCEGEAPPPVKEDVKEKKKKFTADKMDRWGHDMFDVNKQTAKSTQDLIDFYGYDIRNEEEPPKAWRSRRYGRGPNKYTRQWQDEAAYHSKRAPTPKAQGPFTQKEGDFPTMEESRSNFKSGRGRGATTANNFRGRGNYNKPKVVRDRQDIKKKSYPQNQSERRHSTTQVIDNNNKPLVEKPQTREPKPPKDIQIEKTVFLNRKKPFSSAKTKTEAEAEADIAALSKEFSNAVINIGRDGKILPIRATGSNGNNSSPTQGQEVDVKETREEVPPPMAQTVKEKPVRSETTKSKRYSSQRQRSLPQSNHIQQQQQQQPQQQFIHQQQYFPPPPPAPTETDSNLFPNFPGQTPTPVFPEPLPSVVFLPPQYQPTPPPPPHLLNYGLPPPQQFTMPLAPPPPDMFPTQPGITYYSPQNQVAPRPASRRVKVAIPIIAPPEQSLNQPDS